MYICKYLLAYYESQTRRLSGYCRPHPPGHYRPYCFPASEREHHCRQIRREPPGDILHIKILEDCGLLVVRQQGRDRLCEVRLDQLSEVDTWIAQYRQHWESRLDSMEAYVEKLKKERYGKSKK